MSETTVNWSLQHWQACLAWLHAKVQDFRVRLIREDLWEKLRLLVKSLRQ